MEVKKKDDHLMCVIRSGFYRLQDKGKVIRIYKMSPQYEELLCYFFPLSCNCHHDGFEETPGFASDDCGFSEVEYITPPKTCIAPDNNEIAYLESLLDGTKT